MLLSKISIKRPSLVIIMMAMLMIGGIFSYTQLSYELVPKFEIKVVTISTVYPGASPSEVENSLSTKIEDAVSSLENVKKIQTKSFESLSVVIIQFNDDTDINYAINDAQRKINAIRSDLPDGAKEPSIVQFSLSDMPVITMGVTGNMSSSELYDLIDKKIQPEFSRVPGVAQVSIIGGQEREIRINLDPNRMEGYGLSIPQVQQIIAASNLDFPTGNLKTRNNSILIRLSGKIVSVEELRNLTIASQNGMNIKLSDIADVQDTVKDAEKIARINQKNTILLTVQKQSEANAVEVSKLIQKKMTEVESQYAAKNVKLTLANDTSQFTLDAANHVIKDLFLAILLVAFVMLFFLHSLRNAIIVMVSIPTSLIATFIGMYLFGYSLNLMSLLALSLVVGILVDDAIVVIENIHRHMEMGKSKVRAAYDGASEIGFTVTAITLVIVVVFLPIALSTGLVANIISQFCVVVIIATMLSLLVSFTAVPWLFSRFGKLEYLSKNSFSGKIVHKFEGFIDRFTHWVTDILVWCLGHKFMTLAIVTVLFFGTFLLPAFGFVGSGFFPQTNRGEFLVQMELPKDASLEQTNFLTQKAEKILSAKPEVNRIITTVGQSSSGMGSMQTTAYKSEISVLLKGEEERGDEPTNVYAAKLKRELENKLVGAKITTVPMGLMGANQAPIQLIILGNTMEDALAFAKKAEAELRKIPGAAEIKLSVEEGNPEISVQVDRDKMTALGLNVATVGQTMRTAFSGNDDNKFREGTSEYDMSIVLDEAYRRNIDNVKNLTFINQMGQKIQLSQFATVTYGSGPSVLERYDRTPSVTLSAQNVGVATGTIADQLIERLEKIKKPETVSWTWSGDVENQKQGFGTLGFALIAALLLVYMIMVILYNDFVKPFIVMFSIPLAFIGAIWGLALTNESLNIFTILGMIMLIGLVAKNAILLVDFANHRKEEGESTDQALIDANHARLRPILMTTIAMVIGMLPIAMASGDAASMNNGLAIVIIGGLISSLFLTLVIVPVVYKIMVGLEERFTKGEKKDYEALMKEDYTPLDHSEHGHH